MRFLREIDELGAQKRYAEAEQKMKEREENKIRRMELKKKQLQLQHSQSARSLAKTIENESVQATLLAEEAHKFELVQQRKEIEQLAARQKEDEEKFEARFAEYRVKKPVILSPQTRDCIQIEAKLRRLRQFREAAAMGQSMEQGMLNDRQQHELALEHEYQQQREALRALHAQQREVLASTHADRLRLIESSVTRDLGRSVPTGPPPAHRPPTARPPPTAHRPSPIAHRPPPTAHRPPPTAHRPASSPPPSLSFPAAPPHGPHALLASSSYIAGRVELSHYVARVHNISKCSEELRVAMRPAVSPPRAPTPSSTPRSLSRAASPQLLGSSPPSYASSRTPPPADLGAAANPAASHSPRPPSFPRTTPTPRPSPSSRTAGTPRSSPPTPPSARSAAALRGSTTPTPIPADTVSGASPAQPRLGRQTPPESPPLTPTSADRQPHSPEEPIPRHTPRVYPSPRPTTATTAPAAIRSPRRQEEQMALLLMQQQELARLQAAQLQRISQLQRQVALRASQPPPPQPQPQPQPAPFASPPPLRRAASAPRSSARGLLPAASPSLSAIAPSPDAPARPAAGPMALAMGGDDDGVPLQGLVLPQAGSVPILLRVPANMRVVALPPGTPLPPGSAPGSTSPAQATWRTLTAAQAAAMLGGSMTLARPDLAQLTDRDAVASSPLFATPHPPPHRKRRTRRASPGHRARHSSAGPSLRPHNQRPLRVAIDRARSPRAAPSRPYTAGIPFPFQSATHPGLVYPAALSPLRGPGGQAYYLMRTAGSPHSPSGSPMMMGARSGGAALEPLSTAPILVAPATLPATLPPRQPILPPLPQFQPQQQPQMPYTEPEVEYQREEDRDQDQDQDADPQAQTFPLR
ncbi:hypothetical protein PAPYR_906 [Paratrimastix pyriformis]|uniref:Uncharacterized protein n=1 Tax=Paratrimastix pyriformis TaxID=342808 RepID=A0ABQ8UT49_9EUKA|nr:hypothetical protein PAPYR_906 [Paratrimastix pyriformis]